MNSDKIYLYKGQKDILNGKQKKVAIEEIQKELLQVFDVKNLSFLFGAGCSSHVVNVNTELGIPVMASMAEKYYLTLSSEDNKYLKETIEIDIANDNYKKIWKSF